MSWIQTYTGRKFDVLNPRVDDVDIEDIAHALSHICRFTGHTKKFYSVAQHCVYAARLAEPGHRAYALLHDASEAYLCDVARPIKHLSTMHDYRTIERTVQLVIYRALGLDGFIEPIAVKILDERMLVTEAQQLLGPAIEDWAAKFGEPFDLHIIPWSSAYARQMFLATFAELNLCPSTTPTFSPANS